MNWSEKRVFVTGATGLVGGWLVRRLLAEGAYVVALVRDADPQSEFYRAGLAGRSSVVCGRLQDEGTVERALCEHGVDTVFHLGAQTIVGVADRNPVETFESNIRGTYLLLEACRRQRDLVKRILVASSDKAYGATERLPYTEDLPLQGRAPYEASKSCTDLISTCYSESYGLPIVVARCGNIYGGSDLNWSRLIPGTIVSYLRGAAPLIRSDGRFLRDYVYVEDAVDAYLLMAARSDADGVAGEAFNFGPNRPVSVLDVVDLIARLMGTTDLRPVVLNEAAAEIRDQYLDSTKARDRLAWGPKFGLEQGLQLTIDWYRGFLQPGLQGEGGR